MAEISQYKYFLSYLVSDCSILWRFWMLYFKIIHYNYNEKWKTSAWYFYLYSIPVQRIYNINKLHKLINATLPQIVYNFRMPKSLLPISEDCPNCFILMRILDMHNYYIIDTFFLFCDKKNSKRWSINAKMQPYIYLYVFGIQFGF